MQGRNWREFWSSVPKQREHRGGKFWEVEGSDNL